MPFRLIVLLERQIETLNSWFLPSKFMDQSPVGKKSNGDSPNLTMFHVEQLIRYSQIL